MKKLYTKAKGGLDKIKWNSEADGGLEVFILFAIWVVFCVAFVYHHLNK